MDASFFHVYPTDASRGMLVCFGSNKIQAYYFAPINDFSSEMINNTREENKPLKTDLNHDIIDN